MDESRPTYLRCSHAALNGLIDATNLALGGALDGPAADPYDIGLLIDALRVLAPQLPAADMFDGMLQIALGNWDDAARAFAEISNGTSNAVYGKALLALALQVKRDPEWRLAADEVLAAGGPRRRSRSCARSSGSTTCCSRRSTRNARASGSCRRRSRRRAATRQARQARRRARIRRAASIRRPRSRISNICVSDEELRMNTPLSASDLSRALDVAFSDAAAAPAGAGAPAAAPVPAEVAGRFQALMSNAVPTPPLAHAQETSAIAKLVETSDAEIRKVLDNVEYLNLHANEMTMNQMFAASLQASAEATAMQIDMQAKMGVVTSTKDAIGSLMKNQ